MKNMNCIIIDDEKMAGLFIEKLISKNDNLNLINSFSSSVEAIKFLSRESVDLIFLDIHMPDFNGFELIQVLKETPKVIVMTSDVTAAIEAFEYDCIVDFLMKPIDCDRFEIAIQKALNFNGNTALETFATSNSNLKNLYVNIDRRLVKIEFNSINIIEAKGDYIFIKTDAKSYTVHSTLKKIEEKLPDDLFLKVHRSFIINILKIVDIEDNSILIDKDIIPISRSNRPNLMKRLNLL